MITLEDHPSLIGERRGKLPHFGSGSVSCVSRSADHLDVFAVSQTEVVRTAAWQPGDQTWRGWWSVANGKTLPGAPVSAVSRSTDKLDVFVVGLDGVIYTAAWQPADTTWGGWWPLPSRKSVLGAPVSAISRSAATCSCPMRHQPCHAVNPGSQAAV